MLNAIEPGSPLPIHRHRHTSETVVCLRGRLVWEYYDELERICTEARISKSKIAKAARANQTCLSFAESRWHSTKSTAIRPLRTSSHSQTKVNPFPFRHIIVFISQTIKGSHLPM
jgi:hypothetical protein